MGRFIIWGEEVAYGPKTLRPKPSRPEDRVHVVVVEAVRLPEPRLLELEDGFLGWKEFLDLGVGIRGLGFGV